MEGVRSTVIGTWSFSRHPVEEAGKLLNNHATSAIDAVEKGLNVAEENELYGPCIVGRGGPRNSAGFLELDAAIMSGKDLNLGAVTAIRGITRPVSVARKVMEESPHSMLTGEGATSFAVSKGFVIDQELMKSRESRAEDTKCEQSYVCTVHDTLGLLALDTSGNVCSGVTTSGKPNKHPGRVGDSALPGCGFYADSTAGASCCTGDGDEILKFCPSFLAVHYMKQGKSPEEACSQVIKDIVKKLSESSKSIEMAILALNIKGEHGASATFTEWKDPLTGDIYNGFPYTVWREGNQRVQTVLAKARD
ncbi:hypothetical protein ACJMK2_044359 [Sinanodonta woodiana]|uniref:Uncharacterized protein n=1 Tax=Sinanodonta woodiana TaxID=1069815 RepID=A0ABD3VZU9_SINWO